MFDEESGFWVPIPANYTAPHTPEDLIEAENDIRILDHHCIAYVHPEARKTFKELNASREPEDPEIYPLHVYDISKGEEAVLVAGLEGEEVAYKFRKPWEKGYIRYQGSLPQEGAQNAADRCTEMWDNDTQAYLMLPAGYTAPHDPQDYVDAVNYELVRAERHRHSAISLAQCQLHPRKEEGKKEKVTALQDWEAPDLVIESDLSGSDYEVGRCEEEKTRDWCKSRGQSVMDTEEDDVKIDEEDAKEEPDLEHEEEEACEEEKRRSKGKKPLVRDTEEEDEHDLERDKQEEARSKAACLLLSTMKTEGKVHTSSAHWKDLTASYTPSQLDTASLLSSYGLTLIPDALLPDLEEVSSTKPSLLETVLYPMFGQVVWQVAHRLGHLYGRSSDFAMEKVGLLCKEKRAPNRYNLFKTFASRTKPEEGDHEGLQLWNRATNEEYKKLMQGATTKEEKDERIQEAISFIKNQVNEEGTNVCNANLCFASYMKEIRDLITNIKRRDKSFDVAGILVYSGRNLTARNKMGFFMSSKDLQALCTREEWPIATLTDIFVSKVCAMHADQQIKQSMEELNVAPSTLQSPTDN
ncbi:uncharacterized protein LACBIDRAFT_332765 [Laccaria bicolor S238N-H82]|uniref:Predicted protein n=1 Tax=Laccaria bicolor (strain S238N-H82 / ATCC MYA-4686) TaxID=486041 RepID=B0DU06_LACBS|nr:uncharacterized protein LACBIDRAFT_332765 [Laccaria bicolor S238N-H82]EDR01941.1 predicted protein [Laccaria bicolor S238N-H82]|eukprot:XP_001887332.1 predicted protein [Laccaria bicolor S238N-H82]